MPAGLLYVGVFGYTPSGYTILADLQCGGRVNICIFVCVCACTSDVCSNMYAKGIESSIHEVAMLTSKCLLLTQVQLP